MKGKAPADGAQPTPQLFSRKHFFWAGNCVLIVDGSFAAPGPGMLPGGSTQA